MIRQKDTFGVVAYITNCLSEYEINIAFMRLYRESKGEAAYTIIETDNDIPQNLVQKIKQRQEISSAMVIKI